MDKPIRSSRFRYPTVPEVAEVLATARPALPWEREAPARHRIRVLLILQGMPWGRADWFGHSLVARARIERGVGQPRGYDSDTDLSAWVPTEECPVCGRFYVRAFSDQAHCSTACAHAAARNEAWITARVGVMGPPRCLWCNSYMEVSNPAQRYCNVRCLEHAAVLKRAEDADPALATKIRNARMAHRIPQYKLARRLGLSLTIIAGIERGDYRLTDDIRVRLFAELHLDEDGNCELPLLVRFCKLCGAPIPSDVDLRSTFCCVEHARKAGWTAYNHRKRGLPKRLRANGHDHVPDPPADRPDPAGGAGGARPDPERVAGGAAAAPGAD